MTVPPSQDPPRHGAAKVYSRPRFGVKLGRRFWLSTALSVASLAVTGWWIYHRSHP